ncbi:hypothetical protein [Flagellimonas oceanensis]|uniref:hypothetical protein n=1 Tax=Flagellimonas oceanensis TaxID=2499163 RepID=UPI000F8E62AB|nr:hypothetical protein [Allomuricauda oceanensis]
MELKDILGIWRCINEGITIDFNIRMFDPKHGKGRSLFTIYGTDAKGNKVWYEWQGAVVDLISNPDTTFTIQIDNINYTEDKPEYQSLKVWMLLENSIILELANGDRVEFQKLK